MGPHGVDASTFAVEGPAYRIGNKALRVEILTKVDGIAFSDATSAPLHTSVDGATLPLSVEQRCSEQAR